MDYLMDYNTYILYVIEHITNIVGRFVILLFVVSVINLTVHWICNILYMWLNKKSALFSWENCINVNFGIFLKCKMKLCIIICSNNICCIKWRNPILYSNTSSINHTREIFSKGHPVRCSVDLFWERLEVTFLHLSSVKITTSIFATKRSTC